MARLPSRPLEYELKTSVKWSLLGGIELPSAANPVGSSIPKKVVCPPLISATPYKSVAHTVYVQSIATKNDTPICESLFHGTTYQNPTYDINRCPFLGYWKLMPKPLPCSQKTRLIITYVFVTAYATPITHIQSMTYTGYQERGHTDKGEKGNGGIDDHIRRDSENSGPMPWAKR